MIDLSQVLSEAKEEASCVLEFESAGACVRARDGEEITPTSLRVPLHGAEERRPAQARASG